MELDNQLQQAYNAAINHHTMGHCRDTERKDRAIRNADKYQRDDNIGRHRADNIGSQRGTERILDTESVVSNPLFSCWRYCCRRAALH